MYTYTLCYPPNLCRLGEQSCAVSTDEGLLCQQLEWNRDQDSAHEHCTDVSGKGLGVQPLYLLPVKTFVTKNINFAVTFGHLVNSGSRKFVLHQPWSFRVTLINYELLASSPGHSQILSRSRGEKSEKAWDHCYIMDRKCWTRLVQTKSTLHTNHDVAMTPGLLPIFLHDCKIKSGSGLGTRLMSSLDQLSLVPRPRPKIWVGPGDEAMINHGHSELSWPALKFYSWSQFLCMRYMTVCTPNSNLIQEDNWRLLMYFFIFCRFKALVSNKEMRFMKLSSFPSSLLLPVSDSG